MMTRPLSRLASVALMLLANLCAAAPFAQWLEGRSPSGVPVRVWGEGDEYSASFEAEDGHAVLPDDAGSGYHYARQDEATGALIPTPIPLGDETPADRRILADIPLHLRDTSAAAAEERARRIASADKSLGLTRRWEEVKSQTCATRKPVKGGRISRSPPLRPTRGSVVSLTLLVDFPMTNSFGVVTNTLANVIHPDITREHLDDLLNGENCTLFDNASSVRKYFEDTSCGQMSCTNIVLGWFTAPHPRGHYDDPSRSNLSCARELIGDILTQIADDPDFDTLYRPLLGQLSYEGSNFLALNVWFAGPTAQSWSNGLWAHAGTLGPEIGKCLSVDVDGQTLHFNNYQITPVTTSPSIGTFCHESGHLLCGFPDLYDKAFGSGSAAGQFSLMSSSGGRNPCHVDAYLRAAAGWVVPKELPTEPSLLEIADNLADVWKYTNPADPRQYFLIENRQQTGRDAALPGSGILIWRCDEAGGNTRPSPQVGFDGLATNRVNAELSLEQADGLYELERRVNSRDANDLWFRGNGAAGYGGAFTASNAPCAKWRDASDAAIHLSCFSANGETMTFFSGNPDESTFPLFFADPVSGDLSLAFAVTAMAFGKNVASLLVYAEIEPDGGTSLSTRVDYLGRISATGVETTFPLFGLEPGHTNVVKFLLFQEGGACATVEASRETLCIPPGEAPVVPDPSSPPAAPASLSATAGTNVSGVHLVWTAVADALRYAIYRAPADLPGSAELVGRTAQLEYLDIFAPTDTNLLYWVQAENGTGAGDFAGPVGGWRPSPLAVSTEVLAFGVAGTNFAESLSAAGGRPPYSWTLAEGAALPAGLSLDASGLVHGVPLAPFSGTIAVRVTDANATVAQSDVTLDIRSATSPVTVSSLALRSDYGRLVLSWEPQIGVDRYILYRSESASFSTATAIASTSDNTFADTAVTEGTTYFYWVIAENWLGRSQEGFPASGASKVSPVAGDVYVHTEFGDDANDGGSWGAAKRTIQAAVNATPSDGRIVVAPGVYAPIGTANARIAIESAEGPWATIIDGGGTNRCATLSLSDSGTNTLLVGFTLANGRAPDAGGSFGGGSFGGTLSRCIISNCVALSESDDAQGGGSWYGVLRNSLVVGNRAESIAGTACGGGCANSRLINCTVVDNLAETGRSLSFADGGGVAGGSIYNTIVSGNALVAVEGVFRASTVNSTATAYNSAVRDDPLFVHAAGGDWCLASNSVCRATGSTNHVAVADAFDLAGNPRVDDGHVDMGAFQGGVEPDSAPAHVARIRARSDRDSRGVLIRWSSTAWAESYKVYRGGSQPATHSRVIAETTETSYLDTEVGTGRTYWYRIVPCNGFGEPDLDGAVAIPVAVEENCADFYVDAAAGDDAADGRSWATARKSIRAVAPLLDNGDLVLVAPGRYTSFAVPGVSCEIRSMDGAESTVVDGGGTNRCALLAVGGAASTILTGLSLVNGLAADEGVVNCGGGVYGGTLRRCIVSNCVARSEGAFYAYGGGAFRANAWNTRFIGNLASSEGSSASGGGAYAGEFYNCLFQGNEAVSGSASGTAFGGGIAFGDTTLSTIVRNRAGNTAGGEAQGGGAYSYSHYGSLFWDNEAPTGPNIGTNRLSCLYTCCTPETTPYCTGCITADPLFVDAENGDWRLSPESPCIDAGYVGGVYGDVDLQGAARIQGNKVDIGAFEGAYAVGEDPVLPLSVSTRFLPAARVGEAYSTSLSAIGGIPPHSWSILAAYAEYHASNSFATVGTAMGWKGDDKCWQLELPFKIPFYGSFYSNVWVNSNGTLAFDGTYSSRYATLANLSAHPMVAVLWNDLTTTGGDIFVERSADAVTIRWSGAYYAGASIAFSATLHSNGLIRLRYGSGNANGGLIGVSSGGGLGYLVSAAVQSESMENAEDIVFVQTAYPPPDGLSLSRDGVVSGIPVTAGSRSMVVLVEDGAGTQVAESLLLVVEPVPDATVTTPVPVPFAWLEDEAPSLLAAHGGDYETTALATAANGENAVWECYVAGLSPTSAVARFETTIEINADGRPVVSWRPRLSADETGKRVYRTLGKRTLDPDEDWVDVTDNPDLDSAGYRFFKETVRLKEP